MSVPLEGGRLPEIAAGRRWNCIGVGVVVALAALTSGIATTTRDDYV